jgi:hypothetical protein
VLQLQIVNEFRQWILSFLCLFICGGLITLRKLNLIVVLYSIHGPKFAPSIFLLSVQQCNMYVITVTTVLPNKQLLHILYW